MAVTPDLSTQLAMSGLSLLAALVALALRRVSARKRQWSAAG
jgi:hypothetical protein